MEQSETQVAIKQEPTAFRMSTDAASLCRELVIATASKIGGKSYVGVEGWLSVAIAHGCAASADNVERVIDEGMSGFKAIGIVRRMSDGVEIARAEGFLGDDEPTWAKRPVYARRAMVQTRAISRACRSAFAHVVVMMKANLSTTPAEEVPHGGFDDTNGTVIEHMQEEPRKGPVKLDGPYRSPTALKNALHQLERDLRACETTEELEGYLEKESTVALIDQLKRDAKGYVFGSDRLPAEHEPLVPMISRLRTELKVQDEADENSWRGNPLSGG